MSLGHTFKKLFGGTIGAWLNNERDRALDAAIDYVAKKYGAEAAAFVQAAETLIVDGNPLSNPQKLFNVAEKLVDLVAKDGPTLPMLIAIAVAQKAYAQVKKDALTEIHAFLAVAVDI